MLVKIKVIEPIVNDNKKLIYTYGKDKVARLYDWKYKIIENFSRDAFLKMLYSRNW